MAVSRCVSVDLSAVGNNTAVAAYSAAGLRCRCSGCVVSRLRSGRIVRWQDLVHTCHKAVYNLYKTISVSIFLPLMANKLLILYPLCQFSHNTILYCAIQCRTQFCRHLDKMGYLHSSCLISSKMTKNGVSVACVRMFAGCDCFDASLALSQLRKSFCGKRHHAFPR